MLRRRVQLPEQQPPAHAYANHNALNLTLRADPSCCLAAVFLMLLALVVLGAFALSFWYLMLPGPAGGGLVSGPGGGSGHRSHPGGGSMGGGGHPHPSHGGGGGPAFGHGGPRPHL